MKTIEATAYKRLADALYAANARKQIVHEHRASKSIKTTQFDYDLEFWSLNGHSFIIQRWLDHDGWQAYLPQMTITIDASISDLLEKLN